MPISDVPLELEMAVTVLEDDTQRANPSAFPTLVWPAVYTAERNRGARLPWQDRLLGFIPSNPRKLPDSNGIQQSRCVKFGGNKPGVFHLFATIALARKWAAGHFRTALNVRVVRTLEI